MNTPDSQNNPSPTLLDRIRSRKLTATFTILATLSFGILIGSVLTSNVSGKEQQVDSSDAKPLVIPSPTQLSNGFSAIVKQVSPAVVNINTEELPKQSANRRGRRALPQDGDNSNNDDQAAPGGDMQDFFNRFFGGQGGDDGSDAINTERRALGSGFIVDPRGYIITNNHVVANADKIYVKLSTDSDDDADNGRPATVIGVDKDTDIAVIKIDTKQPLPTIKLGNSDGAQVGDWVLAIGSPFALAKTVTAGIISAKNRTIDDPGPNGISQSQFQHFIQTDAAINPGNSGGPLVDMAGQVVGMNTAIYTQSMGSQGVGFAMPSNTIAQIYNMLIGPEHKVVRGSIGISFQQSLSSAVKRMYGFQNGVIVSIVTPSGGAAKAGIQPGDVIVSIDGRNIKDGDDLVADISSRKVGSNVKLGYLRNGKQGTAEVVIGDRAKTYADLAGSDDDDNSASATPQAPDTGKSLLGITVSAVPAAVTSRTGLKSGVIITSVRPGSFADEIGLPKGFVITEINKKPVRNEADYRAIVSTLKSKDDVVFVVQSPAQKNINSLIGGTLP
ncbi:trypsin-like peptidase domain-containing protein [Edaphobacter sp.]|uniref:trypsin-like peptidase domain-containing protein n=1 Tax=Edaphobacter sp. TaxID=1934404 RepID=UPI002DB7EE2A|nr:trypsin-like peptidase domain-containing protein [Edaphobacter sp.]HEU5341758.1 trypsin-like peptidase domain-containing protein [Edaphobacter sp.]